MHRFHGTAARQLVLIDEPRMGTLNRRGTPAGQPTAPRIRLMQKDLYAELTRRRRRAQIAARRLLVD